MSQENDISSKEYLRETYSETKAAPLLHHEDKTTIVTESPKNESPEEKSVLQLELVANRIGMNFWNSKVRCVLWSEYYIQLEEFRDDYQDDDCCLLRTFSSFIIEHSNKLITNKGFINKNKFNKIMSKENDISWVKKLRENDGLETKTDPLICQKDKTTIVIEYPENKSSKSKYPEVEECDLCCCCCIMLCHMLIDD